MSPRAYENELLDPFDRAVERHPRHDFRKREMPRLAARLPHALIGLLPDCLEIFEQFERQVPGVGIALQAVVAAGVKRIAQLALDVELQLSISRVADADRTAAFV